MKNFLLLLTIFFPFAILQSVPSEPPITEIWVSTLGDDNNTGTQAAPIKTINTMMSKISAAPSGNSVNVFIEVGTYEINNATPFQLTISRNKVTITGGLIWKVNPDDYQYSRTVLIPKNALGKLFFSKGYSEIKYLHLDFDMSQNPIYTGSNTEIEKNPCTIWIEGTLQNRANGSLISDCRIFGAQNDAIVIKACNSTIVEWNTIGIIDVPNIPNEAPHARANSISVEAAYDYDLQTQTFSFIPTENITIRRNKIYHNESHHGINLDIGLSEGFPINGVYNRDVYCQNSQIYLNVIEGCEDGIFVRHHQNTQIHNNIIHTNYRLGANNLVNEGDEGHGIRFAFKFPSQDEWDSSPYIWTADAKIYNNTIYYNYNVGINFNEARKVELFNNIISHNGISGTAANGLHSTRIVIPYQDLFDYNLHWDNGQGITNYWTYSGDIGWQAWLNYSDGGNEIFDDPEFENEPTLPWTDDPPITLPDILNILSTSPAIDAGINLASLGYYDRDMWDRQRGYLWDIGAYEYEGNLDEINVEYASIISPSIVEIGFNSTLDSNSIKKKNLSVIGNKIKKVTKIGSQEIQIEFSDPLQNNIPYILTMDNIKNNNGKKIIPQFASLIINKKVVPKIHTTNTGFNYSLTQNYPNPFNPITFISYSIPKQSLVQLKVFDILGREVETIINDFQSEGTYKIKFDASDLSSGIYLYTLAAGDYYSTRKMLLLK